MSYYCTTHFFINVIGTYLYVTIAPVTSTTITIMITITSIVTTATIFSFITKSANYVH